MFSRYMNNIDKVPLKTLEEMDEDYKRKFSNKTITEREANDWRDVKEAIRRINCQGSAI